MPRTPSENLEMADPPPDQGEGEGQAAKAKVKPAAPTVGALKLVCMQPMPPLCALNVSVLIEE